MKIVALALLISVSSAYGFRPNNATQGQFPSVVGVGTFIRGKFTPHCTAFILNKEWIIGQTAEGGCHRGNMRYIAAGSSILNNETQKTQVHKINKIIFAKGTDNKIIGNIFAALLVTPLEFNNFVKASQFARFPKRPGTNEFDDVFLPVFHGSQLKFYKSSQFTGDCCQKATKQKNSICVIYSHVEEYQNFNGSAMVTLSGQAIGTYNRLVSYKIYPMLWYTDIRQHEDWILDATKMELPYAPDEDELHTTKIYGSEDSPGTTTPATLTNTETSNNTVVSATSNEESNTKLSPSTAKSGDNTTSERNTTQSS